MGKKTPQEKSLADSVANASEIGGAIDLTQNSNNIEADTWGEFFLPSDCPVKVLGKSPSNKAYHFISAAGVYVCLARSEINTQTIMQLFEGAMPYLFAKFHAWKKGKDEDGNTIIVPDTKKYEVQRLQACIYSTASMVGIVELDDKLRGLGAWRAADGNLVINCGDYIYEFNKYERRHPIKKEPCVIGVNKNMVVYEGRHPVENIATKSPKYKDVKKLSLSVIEDFRSWNWVDDSHPYLLLGHVLSMFFGGALSWRPMVWLSGEKGDGKSYLQGYIEESFGGWSRRSDDTTEAAIRQTLRFDSLGVQLDEIESAGITEQKMEGLKKLMRLAASGSITWRGQSNHTAASFTMRSAMLLSSIYVPVFNAQDDSRVVQLHLQAAESDARSKYDVNQIRGQFLPLFSYFCHNWYKFEGWYGVAWAWLHSEGLDDRVCDVHAPLVMFAYIACESEEISAERLVGLFPNLITFIKSKHTLSASDAILKYLGECQIRLPSGDQSLAQLITLASSNLTGDEYSIEVLKRYGLMVDFHKQIIFIPNSHSQLSKLFENSEWASVAGGRGSVWQQIFARNDLFTASRKQYNGQSARGFDIPLEFVIDK